MDVTRLAGRCPRCGTALAPDAPEGLCAACLLTAANETLTHASGDVDTPTMLSPLSASGVSPGSLLRLEEGQSFGPYRIGRLLGRGGMGEVYEAEHVDTGRRLALKVLRARLNDREDRARFLREGQLAASVSHPHTVYIFGSEEIAGMPVISMELLPGGTLKDRVAVEGPLTPAAAVAAVLDLAGGLDAAAAAGILHRDIKPSNCFVDVDGTVKVGDFGLSISTLARDVKENAAAAGFEGTPQFAAPEQLRGEPLDVRADIYAVGATLYYLLTGQPPFDARDLRELFARVTTEPARSPRQLNPRIPAPLAAIVLQCLEKDPRARPSSYAALAEMLRPFSPAATMPAHLGLRLMAGIVDAMVIGLPFTLLAALSVTSPVRSGLVSIDMTAVWGVLAGFVYFVVAEGRWSASIGKRLFGLRVVGVTGTASLRQIVIRTAIYWSPSLPSLIAIWIVGPGELATFLGANPAIAVPFSLLRLVLGAALYLTIRRSNGYAALHDRWSGTRVVMRHAMPALRATGPDARAAAGAIHRAAGAAAATCGPFDVTDDLGEVSGGRLLGAFDHRLRRRVWIRAVPAGTPPISDARRDISRVGRLRWLAGRRSSAENWDAFEAPSGAALLARGRTAGWAVVKQWLLDLVAELKSSHVDRSTPPLALDAIWIRSDGRAVLLDFPAPGLRTREATRGLTPIALLGEVSRYTLGDDIGAGAATRTTPAPIPVSAVALLERWSRGAATSLDEARIALTAAAAAPDRVPRLRRAIPIGLAGVIVALAIAGSVAILPALRRTLTPEFFELYGLLQTAQSLDGKDAAAAIERRRAIDVYLAARYRDLITDDAFWLDPIRAGLIRLRPTGSAAVAAHPFVSPDELAGAAATLAPDRAQLAKTYDERVGPQLATGGLIAAVALVGIVTAFVGACQLLSTLIAPGGLVYRLLGLVVVDRRGVPVRRARSLARVLVAWLPVLAAAAVFGWNPYRTLLAAPVRSTIVLGVAIVLMAAGAMWTIARRVRGPHDLAAGTWVAPR